MTHLLAIVPVANGAEAALVIGFTAATLRALPQMSAAEIPLEAETISVDVGTGIPVRVSKVILRYRHQEGDLREDFAKLATE